MRWFYSTNPKIIGNMFLGLGVSATVLGALLMSIIRLELNQTDSMFKNDQIYNSVLVSYTLMMIFFVMLPTMVGGLGNLLTSAMSMNPTMAFPRMNNMSFWFLLSSLILMISSTLASQGGGAEWATYPPLSSQIEVFEISVDLMILSLYLASISFIMSSLNFIASLLSVSLNPTHLENTHRWFSKSSRLAILPLTLVSFPVYSTLPILVFTTEDAHEMAQVMVTQMARAAAMEPSPFLPLIPGAEHLQLLNDMSLNLINFRTEVEPFANISITESLSQPNTSLYGESFAMGHNIYCVPAEHDLFTTPMVNVLTNSAPLSMTVRDPQATESLLNLMRLNNPNLNVTDTSFFTAWHSEAIAHLSSGSVIEIGWIVLTFARPPIFL